MKNLIKIGYVMLIAMSVSMLAIGCSGNSDEVDNKPPPNLDGLPKAPPDATMNDGPGAKK